MFQVQESRILANIVVLAGTVSGQRSSVDCLGSRALFATMKHPGMVFDPVRLNRHDGLMVDSRQ